MSNKLIIFRQKWYDTKFSLITLEDFLDDLIQETGEISGQIERLNKIVNNVTRLFCYLINHNIKKLNKSKLLALVAYVNQNFFRSTQSTYKISGKFFGKL